MINEPLNDENFILYCARHYKNDNCTNIEEFYEDIRRVRYIKKLLTRYEKTGDCKDRLILNHLTILSNLYDPEHLCRILYFKLAPQFKYVKPFLILLNVLPNRIHIDNVIVDFNMIPLDQKIVDLLRNI